MQVPQTPLYTIRRQKPKLKVSMLALWILTAGKNVKQSKASIVEAEADLRPEPTGGTRLPETRRETGMGYLLRVRC